MPFRCLYRLSLWLLPLVRLPLWRLYRLPLWLPPLGRLRHLAFSLPLFLQWFAEDKSFLRLQPAAVCLNCSYETGLHRLNNASVVLFIYLQEVGKKQLKSAYRNSFFAIAWMRQAPGLRFV